MLESFSLDRYFSEKLIQIVGAFPIISEIIQLDPLQLKRILQYCKIFKYLPREEIIGKGRYNPWAFFVLSGECLVLENDLSSVPVEIVQTGQLFGELDIMFDTTGQRTVVADPNSDEVVLLGFNCAVFTAQTMIRLLPDITRITLYQAMYDTLLTRLKQMQESLTAISGDEEAFRFESSAFKGEIDSKEHLIFYDIETKRLAIVMNALRNTLLDAVKKNDYNFPKVNTLLTNKKYQKANGIKLISELPFRLRSSNKETQNGNGEVIQTELEKSTQKTIYTIKELSFLVVDDDEHQRENAVRVLQELGARTIHVEKNGQAAWNFICGHPNMIDIVLCDWIMPEMTGLDLYNSIQHSAEHLKDIIFIMLTSLESKTSVVEAVESGVHGYVIKPVSQKYILKQIQQALKHVRGASLKT